MKQEVEDFVRQCDTCLRNKEDNTRLSGLLQPLPIPDRHISMDFTEGLPKSHGKDVILVVMDRFTKYGDFIALEHPFTSAQVAEIFMQNISSCMEHDK